jgi:hypothetical protein
VVVVDQISAEFVGYVEAIIITQYTTSKGPVFSKLGPSSGSLREGSGRKVIY